MSEKLKKPSRKPGRPKLSAEEKQNRAKLRAQKKSTAQKKSDQALQDTKNIINNSNETSLEEVLKPIQKPTVLLDSDSNDSELKLIDFLKISTNQMEDLNTRIEALEETYELNQIRLNALTISSNTIKENRNFTKSLIRNHQDEIYELETMLDQMLLETPASNDSINKSLFLRRLTTAITRKPDEILMQVSIAQREAQIAQRNRLLQNINQELADILVALKFSEDLDSQYEQILEQLRLIRFKIGRNTRQLKERLNENQVQANQNEMIKTFFENLQKGAAQVESIVENIGILFMEAQNSAKDMTRQFQQTQNNELTKVESSFQLDNKISEFLKFNKNKK